METLDNPVWHALAGEHARFAESDGLARRYAPDVAAFAALPDDPARAAWDALGRLVGPGGVAVLFRPAPVEPPSGWEVLTKIAGLQMVATRTVGRPAGASAGTSDRASEGFVRLGPADTDEMLALVELTRPGPFARRTVELGTYLGHRDLAGGPLLAMAGERVHPPGYTEVSAVCTHPDARRRGLAARLVRAVAAGIEARGEIPVLHVLADNFSAIRVYEALGFSTRVAFDTLVIRAPR